MKEKITTTKSSYTVTLDGTEYSTYAHNKQGAISNAAFRMAKDLDESVRLVMWKIKEGQIDCEVFEE